MKKFPLILSLILIISLLSGCAGTPVVYYTNCTCPPSVHENTSADIPVKEETLVPTEGALKLGVAVSTTVKDSKAATADADGQAKYTVNIAAVLVDEQGVIRSCIIDSVDTSIKFDATGAFVTDLSAEVLTKGEKGEAYGMKASGSKYEWNEQVNELAKYAVNKTADELKNGAIDETGKVKDADLASVASIYIGGHVADIVKATENAKHLGAESGDVLKMAVISKISGSTAASVEKDGNAQLDVDIVAMTMNGETITSCYLDSVQAKVAFDVTGAIVTDLSAEVLTKGEKGEAYGMKASGSKYEWNEQAASFAEYVTDKTVEQVAGIHVTEDTKAVDADITAKVTIKIGGFMDLIAKAAK